MSTPNAAPTSVSRRFSTRSNRRSRGTPAPSAARNTSSCSRRTPRMSVRFTTFAAEMIMTNAAAAMSSHSVSCARSPSASLKGMTVTRSCAGRIVRVLVIAHHSRVHRHGLGARLLERRARLEPHEHLGHAMRAPLHHHRARVVRADHQVEKRIDVLRKQRCRLKDADHGHGDSARAAAACPRCSSRRRIA